MGVDEGLLVVGNMVVGMGRMEIGKAG